MSTNWNMNNISPKTPKKKYVSPCTPGDIFATPKTIDDSDSSLYYSFVVSDDEIKSSNKENSNSENEWTVTSSTPEVSLSTASTSLLRMVLQPSCTPRNKINKRVSFKHLSIQTNNSEHKTVNSCNFSNEKFNSERTRNIDTFDESKESALEISQKDADNALSDTDNFEGEKHNTIIENPLSISPNNSHNLNKQEHVQKIDNINLSKHSEQVSDVLKSQVFSDSKVTFGQITVNQSQLRKKTIRPSNYTRRSSIYEPRKVNPRKSLEVLKKVANKVSGIVIQNATITKTNKNGISKMSKNRFTLGAPSKVGPTHLRNSTAAIQPRLTITSHGPNPVLNNIRAQRRETKHTITNMAVISAKAQSNKTNFVKPNINKCKYCDKIFVKSNAMATHLLEKCEKIPSAARRQLFPDGAINSKQGCRREKLKIDNINKYSSFFEEIMKNKEEPVDIENSLKNLRKEFRKTKNPHTGIIRTPKKPLKCHICKKIFMDCVEYADHITNHSKN